MMTDSIFIGGGGPDHKLAQSLLLARSNRHGLVAGATGTGKTVTLQVMAEQFSAAGVPVFCADVKGDLSGICVAGAPEGKMLEKFNERAAQIGLEQLTYRLPPASSGTSMARPAIRSARPFRKWGRSFWPACSAATTRRKASSPSPSSMQTTTTCCCSTSRTCAAC
jgi:hypothetical protein